MDFIERLVPLIGRFLLSFIFLSSGLKKIFSFGPTSQYMESNGMIFPEVFLVAAIILLLFGSISLILGWKTKLGALALIFFLIPATLIFHMDFGDQMQTIMFMKNVSILGGLLILFTQGPGPLSIDGKSNN